MSMKGIYTVVLHSLVGDEDSTVSFENFDDAVEYVCGEELKEAGASNEEIADCREDLNDTRVTKYGNWEYTIYDAKLVLAKKVEG